MYAVGQFLRVGEVGVIGQWFQFVPQAEEHGLVGRRRREDAEHRRVGQFQILAGIQSGLRPVADAPVAQFLIVEQGFQIEASEAAVYDGRPVGGDRHGGNAAVRAELAAADQAAVEARPLEVSCAAVGIGDLDAVEVVLESGVAAAGDNRTFLVWLVRRQQAGSEPALAGGAVRQALADVVAVFPVCQA